MAGRVRYALPHYTQEALRAEPHHLLEYVQAPPADDTQRLAYAAADLHVLPLLEDPHDAERRNAAVRRAHSQNEEAVQQLHHAEWEARNALAAALNEEGIAADEDITAALERLAESVAAARPAPSRTPPAPHPRTADTLAQLYIARSCTQLLADADEAQAALDAAHAEPHPSYAKIAALTRLTALINQVPHSGEEEGSLLLQRTTAELKRRRDTLYVELQEQYHDALRRALHAVRWPPPEHQNPEAEREAHAPPFRLRGHPDVEAAWADVCELQLTAAHLGLCAPPSCLHTLPSVSGTELMQHTHAQPGSDAYTPLAATNILFQPILLRFRYHFDGDRPTNRLDKPEWFLRHMLALVQRNSALFAPAPDAWTPGGDVCELTRLRRSDTPGAAFRERHLVVDTAAELLHGILFPLRRKIHASMELLVHEPALLAHNLFQLLTFDQDMREVYKPACTVAKQRGALRLADDILGNDTWFQAWLDGEREFAQRRFEAVLEAPSAWSLVQADTLTEEADPSLDAVAADRADTDAAADAHTTTRCAATLIHILVGVTERYQPLHSLGRRCAFVIRVQRPLLNDFATRLKRHLDAFENLSGAFSRAIPGEISSLSSAGSNDMVRGTNGMSRVAKALLSAEYVRQQLEEWSESSFFLSMGEDVATLDKSSPLLRLMLLSQSPQDLDSANLIPVLKRGLQCGAHAAATLRPLAPSTGTSDPEISSPVPASDEPTPGIWEGTQAQFAEIANRSKYALERLVISEVLEQLRPYIVRYVAHVDHSRWDRDETSEQASDPDAKNEEEDNQDIPTRELLPALAKLATLLTYMVQILPPRLLLPQYREIAGSLSRAVVDRILMPNARIAQQFAPQQARRFQLDVQQGWLHVVKELSNHPKITARCAKREPTGLGNNPESAWRLLIDASQQLA